MLNEINIEQRIQLVIAVVEKSIGLVEKAISVRKHNRIGLSQVGRFTQTLKGIYSNSLMWMPKMTFQNWLIKSSRRIHRER